MIAYPYISDRDHYIYSYHEKFPNAIYTQPYKKERILSLDIFSYDGHSHYILPLFGG